MLQATDLSLPFKQPLHFQQWSEMLQLACICTSTIQFLVSVLVVQVSKYTKRLKPNSYKYGKCTEIVKFNMPYFLYICFTSISKENGSYLL